MKQTQSLSWKGQIPFREHCLQRKSPISRELFRVAYVVRSIATHRFSRAKSGSSLSKFKPAWCGPTHVTTSALFCGGVCVVRTLKTTLKKRLFVSARSFPALKCSAALFVDGSTSVGRCRRGSRKYDRFPDDAGRVFAAEHYLNAGSCFRQLPTRQTTKFELKLSLVGKRAKLTNSRHPLLAESSPALFRGRTGYD